MRVYTLFTEDHFIVHYRIQRGLEYVGNTHFVDWDGEEMIIGNLVTIFATSQKFHNWVGLVKWILPFGGI